MQIDAEPVREHRWLDRLVGEWSYENEANMGPDQPPVKFRGTESVRSLGGLWIVCEGEGETPDAGPSKTILTLGYDPKRGRFVGTFIASMMTHLWPYDGALDAEEKVLTLDSEGPDFTGQKSAKYRDSIELIDDDNRLMRSSYRDEDGAWHQFMKAHYRRAK